MPIKKVDKEDGNKHLFKEHNDCVKTLLGYYYFFLFMYTFTETPKYQWTLHKWDKAQTHVTMLFKMLTDKTANEVQIQEGVYIYSVFLYFNHYLSMPR